MGLFTNLYKFYLENYKQMFNSLTEISRRWVMWHHQGIQTDKRKKSFLGLPAIGWVVKVKSFQCFWSPCFSFWKIIFPFPLKIIKNLREWKFSNQEKSKETFCHLSHIDNKDIMDQYRQRKFRFAKKFIQFSSDKLLKLFKTCEKYEAS